MEVWRNERREVEEEGRGEEERGGKEHRRASDQRRNIKSGVEGVCVSV